MEIKELSPTTISLCIYSIPQTLPRPVFSNGRVINKVAPLQALLGNKLRILLPLKISFPLWEEGIPLSVSFLFSFPLPTSWSLKKKKVIAKHRYVKTPDIDNIIKFYLDSFNKLLYADDKQISSLSAVKQWSCVEEEGYVEMSVREERD